MNTVWKMMSYLIVACLLTSCVKKVPKTGIIREKAAGYNRETASFEYHTIVECSDGFVREVDGISAYSKPIGTTIIFFVYE